MFLVAAFDLLAIAGVLYISKAIYETGGHLESDWPRAHQLWGASFSLSLFVGTVSIAIASLV